MNKKNYQLDINETAIKCETNIEKGLTSDEVSTRLNKYGQNKLNEGKKRSIFMKFLDQLNDFMVFVLLGAALISVVLAVVQGESSEIFEGILILAIVLINAILGVIQEGKAEKALESIKKMSSPQQFYVMVLNK